MPSTVAPVKNTRPRGRFHPVVSVFAIVVLFHLAAMVAIHVWSLNAQANGFSPLFLSGDDGIFHYWTAQYMTATGDYSLGSEGIQTSIWPFFMAQIFRMVGSDSVFLIKLLGFAAIVLMFVCVAALVRLLKPDSDRSVIYGLVAVGFYPSLVVYAYLSLYRDTWMFFLHISTVLLLATALNCKSRGRAALFYAASLFPGLLLFSFRNYESASIYVGLLAYWPAIKVLRWCGNRFGLYGQAACFFLLMTAALFAIMQSPVGGVINVYREFYTLVQAGGNLGIDFRGTSALKFPGLFWYSFISNVYGPLPWQVSSLASAGDFLLEAPFLWLITFQLFKYRLRISQLGQFVLFEALVWFATFSLSNDNVGTATRLRIEGWILVIVVWASCLGPELVRKKRESNALCAA